MYYLKRIWPLILLLLVLALILYLDVKLYLSFDALQRYHAELKEWTVNNYLSAVLSFMGIYIVAVAVSVPGAVFLTLAGGFLFGPIWGSLMVISSATIGATLLFLAVHTALGEWLEQRATHWLNRMREGFQRNAFSYLLTLRLIPAFPFWVVNIVPALLGVPLRTYVLATFFGIMPGSVVLVMVGNGLSHVFAAGERPNLGIIFTWPILAPLIGLALLSLLPVIYRHYKDKKHASEKKL